MAENWQHLIDDMNGAVHELVQASPGVMKSFAEMSKAAHAGTALSGKTKELIALALGVATRCSPCIAYHAEGAIKQGASRAEVAETLGMAIYMGAGPSVMYAAKALQAVGELSTKEPLFTPA